MAQLLLEIVTPDKSVLSKEVDYLSALGVEGRFGILPGHIPFLSALGLGSLEYKIGNKEYYVFISGGFSEVAHNKITILAESAELAEDIDEARALAAKERAEERLRQKAENINIERATASLARAIERIRILEKIR